MTPVRRTALAAWELVGKEEQDRSNLRLKLAQRLYEWPPFWEQYVRGSLEIHAHVVFDGLPRCVVFSANPPLGDGPECCHGEVHVYRGKFPVFVGVREIAKDASPFASFVGLKLANDCNVFFADAFEVSLAPRREALLRILDQELSSALRRSGVACGKNVDQVIERRAKVVKDFSGKHARSKPQGINHTGGRNPFPSLRVFVGSNAVFARAGKRADDGFEIRQVFACPFSTQVGALKFIHEANCD